METTSIILILSCLALLSFCLVVTTLGIVVVFKKAQEMEKERRDDDAQMMKMFAHQCLAISEHNLDYLRSQRDNPERVPPIQRFDGTPAPTNVDPPQDGFNPAF